MSSANTDSAVPTGLEPATSGLTGRRELQLHHGTRNMNVAVRMLSGDMAFPNELLLPDNRIPRVMVSDAVCSNQQEAPSKFGG